MKKLSAFIILICLLKTNSTSAQSCATNCLYTDDVQWISTDIDAELGTEGTLEAWIYPTDVTLDNSIIFCQSSTTGLSNTMMNLRQNQLELSNFIPNSSPYAWHAVLSATTLSANTWYHVAATWYSANGNMTIKLYINGILDANSQTFNNFTWTTTSSYDLCIGGWDQAIIYHQDSPDAPFSFAGKIDEARVWSVRRTQCEIFENMRTFPVSTTNLIGYYQFNDTWSDVIGDCTPDTCTQDVSGNSHTGFLHRYTGSSMWVTSDAPVFSNGNGCSLHTTNTYSMNQTSAGAGSPRFVSTLDKTLLAPTEGTVEAWIYLTSIDGDHNAIVAQHHSGGLTETIFEVSAAGKVRFNNYLGVIGSPAVNTWLAVTGNTTLCVGQWYHVAATWNCSGSDNILKVYVNGALDGTYSTPVTGTKYWHTNNTYNVGVGAWMNQATADGANNYCLIGYLDEVRIWSDDLSETDIRNTMYFTGSLTGTLDLYYKFSNSMSDTSGNGLTGSPYNGTVYYSSTYLPIIDPVCSGSNCRQAHAQAQAATLHGNSTVSVFPNPTESEATISFGLSHDAEVVLNVYDLKGRLISTVDGGTMRAGENSLQLSTSDLTEGIYVCELVDGSETRNVRLVVAR